MPTPVSQKLKIKPHTTLLTLNAPPGFKKSMGTLPAGVKIVTTGRQYDQVHWFVLTRTQLEKELGKVLKLLKEGTMIWVYYPKGTSKLQTDLTRDIGWDSLLKHSDKLAWINLISFDDTWSTFGFRAKTEADKKKDAKPKADREIFNYVNPSTKEVRLPDDLAAALKKNATSSSFFQSLSFTNKKEYVEWIVTAKREETRKDRVNATLEKLAKGWKNPVNR